MPSQHPGQRLQSLFLDAKGITQYRLAKSIGVPPRRINEIVKGLRGITADTALRLAKFYGNSPEYWLGLQIQYDLALERARLHDTLVGIEQGAVLGEGETDVSGKTLPSDSVAHLAVREPVVDDPMNTDPGRSKSSGRTTRLRGSRQRKKASSKDQAGVQKVVRIETDLEGAHQGDLFG